MEPGYGKKINNVLNWINPVLLCSVFSLFLFSGLNSRVNYDAGAYLPSAGALSQHLFPYHSFAFRYPPFGLIYFATWMKLFPGISYSAIVFSQLALVVFSSLLVYYTLPYFIKSAAFQRLFTLLFALMNFYFRCFDIGLFPFLTFFALLTLFLLLKSSESKNLFFIAGSGIASAFCCFSKQFGFLIYIPILLYFLVSVSRKELKVIAAVYFISSALLAFAAGLLAMRLAWDVSFYEYYSSILGNEFVKNYPNKNLSELTNFGWHHVFYFFPGIIFLIPVLSQRISSRFILVLALLLFSLSILIIRQYLNYFLFPLPFLILVLSHLTDNVSEKRISSSLINKALPLIFYTFLAWTVISVSYYSYKINRRMIFTEKEKKDSQLKTAQSISEAIPANATTLNLSDLSLNYLCKFHPARFREKGYTGYERKSFLKLSNTGLDPNIPVSLDSTQFVLCDSLSGKDFPGIDSLLPAHHFELSATVLRTIFVWKKE